MWLFEIIVWPMRRCRCRHHHYAANRYAYNTTWSIRNQYEMSRCVVCSVHTAQCSPYVRIILAENITMRMRTTQTVASKCDTSDTNSNSIRWRRMEWKKGKRKKRKKMIFVAVAHICRLWSPESAVSLLIFWYAWYALNSMDSIFDGTSPSSTAVLPSRLLSPSRFACSFIFTLPK